MFDRLAIAAVSVAVGAGVATLITRWRFQRTPRGKPTPALPVDTTGVLARGSTAVIIGCASGIGRATALRCVRLGMKVLLADIETKELEGVRCEAIAAGARWNDILLVTCDCRSEEQMMALKREAYSKFGAVHLLMNNAAVQTNGQCGPYTDLDRWRKIIDTNLWGVYLGGHAFIPSMIEQSCPCIVVNTGSKQGITMPPGDTAYNVSKAGVKVLTEALQHTLRSTPGCKVNAFLLVPGFTATKIITRGQKWIQGNAFDPAKATDEEYYEGVANRAHARERFKQRGAWSADEVVDVLFDALTRGSPFYIICQDHETTLAQDQGRMQWAFDDVIYRRAPLSRWSEQYKDEFKTIAKGFA